MKLKKLLLQTKTQSGSVSLSLLLIRLIAGSAFMIHGWGKIQHPTSWMGPDAAVPAFLQFLAAFAEFGGGLGWILGLLVPLASFGIFCTMTVAVVLHSLILKDPFISTTHGGSSYELALVYWGISILLFTLGSGRFSLSALMFREKAGR